MGVHGLWPLLEPVGRRINIEAITNKRLAVGARRQHCAVLRPALPCFAAPVVSSEAGGVCASALRTAC